MSRMALQTSDVEGLPEHEVTRAHNPDYKSALDSKWATGEHDYLRSTEAWKGHLKSGLSRHEDSTGLLLKGSQHYKAAGDATAGTMWRGQLQSDKHHETSGDRHWVPTSNTHSKSALAKQATEEQKRAIEARYKELLAQTNMSDDVVTHARGVESWYQNVGNEGRRVSKKTSSSSPKKKSSSPKKKSSSSTPRMLSPQERDQKRLERARLRAERKSSYKGLTKEEALRIGNASNKFRDDRNQQQQQEIEFLSPQEKERRRLELARARAERQATYRGLSKEEALRIGEASNTFRVDWEQERKRSPPMNVLNAKDREHQRLVQAAARARRHEREGGDYHGIRSSEDAKRIGLENNYRSPKGVAFDIAM